MEPKTTLQWIQAWYQTQCNGDWEHSFGIKINTLDNPGWHVTIDLNETSLQGLTIPSTLADHSEEDWYVFKIENSKYEANGDPSKLTFLLEKFREIVENQSS